MASPTLERRRSTKAVDEISKVDGFDKLTIMRVYADDDSALAISCLFYLVEEEPDNRAYFVDAKRDGGQWRIRDIDVCMVGRNSKDKIYAELGRFWDRNPNAQLLRSRTIDRLGTIPVLTSKELEAEIKELEAERAAK